MENENPIDKKAEFYIPRTYAKSKVNPVIPSTYRTTSTKYSTDYVAKMVQSGYSAYKELQKISNYLWNVSASYQNFCYYMATILTYDWWVFPDGVTGVQDKTIQNRVEQSARVVHNMQIQESFPMIVLRAIINGETYWYDSSDESNTIIEEIPSYLCQLAMIDDNNTWRYYVNLALINSTNLMELPKEIQDAYEKYTNQPKENQKSVVNGIPSNLHLVSDRGFSFFIHREKRQHDYPFFISMFVDLSRLEDDKDYYNNFLKSDNVKLIHQLIPTDDEGIPLMDEGVIRQYHESAKEHLPDNVAPLTNPFKVTGITMDSSQTTAKSVVEVSKQNVLDDSGISETMFSANTTTGLKYSTKADASKISSTAIYYFTNIVNRKIKEFKTKCKIFDFNQHDKQEWHKQYYTDMSMGNNRALFIASGHMDMYEFLMTAKYEQMLDIDNLLPNKESSFNSSQSETGRPTTDNPTDSTEKVREIR